MKTMKRLMMLAAMMATGVAWAETDKPVPGGHGLPVAEQSGRPRSPSAAECRLVAEPYGACCHISRGWAGEWTDREVLLKQLKEAGLKWIRYDLDAADFMTGPNEFKAEFDERALAPAKAGVKLDAIVPGRVTQGFLAWPWQSEEKMTNFLNYVGYCVKRWGKDIKTWELWNEPNWGGNWNPSAKVYPNLLKRTYETVKAIDPEATVAYTGLALVHLEWIEETLKGGAGPYFDVMNLHPYCAPELVMDQLKGCRELMAKYGAGEKPIWITEFGATTMPVSMFYDKILPTAFRDLGLDRETVPVAYAKDKRYEMGTLRIPGFKTVALSFDEVKRIDPKEYPVFNLNLCERVPRELVDALARYVREGGTLILPSGLPMYYETFLDEGGRMQQKQVETDHLAKFHLAWDAAWTRKDYEEKWQRTCGAYSNDFVWVSADHERSERMISTRNLKPGDTFIPYVELGGDTFKAPFIGLFKFNSELKGNVLMSAIKSNSTGQTEESQAASVLRSAICNFAGGAERVFVYCLRDNCGPREYFESHWGLIRRDHTPKKAYWAVRTLARAMLPGGSTVPEVTHRGNLYLAKWTRPDGVKVAAVWALENEGEHAFPLAVTGRPQVFDMVGNVIAAPQDGTIALKDGEVKFLVGGDVGLE